MPDSSSESLSRRFGLYWTAGALYLAGTALAQGCVFFAGILLANILGNIGYGAYVLTYSTAVTSSQIAQFGIGYMANRYLGEYSNSAPPKAHWVFQTLYRVHMLLASTASVLLFLAADSIAEKWLLRPELHSSIRLAAFGLWFSVSNGFFLGALAGFHRYRDLTWGLAMGGVSYLVAVTVMAGNYGQLGAIAGFVAGQIIQNLCFRFALRDCLSNRKPRLEGFEKRVMARALTRFGIPGALSGLTALPALWLGNMLMARQPSGYSEVAIYNAAYSIAALVLYLPNVLNFVGMTLLNSYKGMGQTTKYFVLFRQNLIGTLVATFLGLIVVWYFGDVILTIYGDQFKRGYSVLLILGLAVIPEALTIAMNQVVQSKERMWTALLYVNVPRDLLIVFASLMLISDYGALGMAYAYLAGRLTAAATTTAIALRLGHRF